MRACARACVCVCVCVGGGRKGPGVYVRVCLRSETPKRAFSCLGVMNSVSPDMTFTGDWALFFVVVCLVCFLVV